MNEKQVKTIFLISAVIAIIIVIILVLKRKAAPSQKIGDNQNALYDETSKIRTYLDDYDMKDTTLGVPPSFYETQSVKYTPDGAMPIPNKQSNNLLYSLDKTSRSGRPETYSKNGLPIDTDLLPLSVDYDVFSKDKSCLLDKGYTKEMKTYDNWTHVGTVYPIDMRLQSEDAMMPILRRGIGKGEYEYKIIRKLPEGDRVFTINGVIRDKYRIPAVPGMEDLGDLNADFFANYKYDWTLN